MAYGKYKGERWERVFSNKGYYIDVLWDYKQDPVANTTYYRVRAVKLTSHSGWYVNASKSSTVGMGVAQSITRIKEKQSANMSDTNQSIMYDLDNIGREVNHDSEGVVINECNVWGKVHVVANAPDLPPDRWYYKNVNEYIDDIDRRAGHTSASFTSSTTSSIKLLVVSDVWPSDYGRYRVNNGKWVNFKVDSKMQVSGGGSMSLTVSNLKPNTSYNIDVQFQRAYNEKWNSIANVTASTKKSSTPAPNPTPEKSKSVIHVFNGQTNKFDDYESLIYENGWIPAEVKVYDDKWKEVE